MPEWIRIRISQVLVKRLRDEYLVSKSTTEGLINSKVETTKVL